MATSHSNKPDDSSIKDSRLASALANMAKVLRHPGERISMGEHAALRRMNPLQPGPAAAIVCRLLQERDITLPDSDDAQLLRWCVIVHALALAHGAHSKAMPIGKALWEMGYSEQRINQLLVSDADGLAQIVPRLARRLHASKVAAMDFVPLMHLLLASSEEVRNRARLVIARSCVRASSALTHTPSTQEIPS